MAGTARYALISTSSDNALVAAQPTGGALVTTTSTARALTCGIDAVGTAGRDLDRLVRHTVVGIKKTPLQRLCQDITRREVVEGGSFIGCTILGGIGGAGLSLLSHLLLGPAHFVPLLIGGLATGATVVPVAAGILKVGERQKRIAKERMVELADLRDPIARFRDAEGPAKVQIGLQLVKVRDELEREQVLSPEARAALKATAAELDALPVDVRDSAKRLEALSAAVSGPIDNARIATIRTQLEATPPHERAELAAAVRDVIFSDRKRVAKLAYPIRNELYDFLEATIAAAGSGNNDA